MKLRSAVVVSRLWKKPEILCQVTEDGISLSISGEHFIASVVESVGNPSLLVTKKQLEAALVRAFAEVIDEVKRASVAVV